MKICPNCKVDCENHAKQCKNCTYSFIEGRVMIESDDRYAFKKCPNCFSEVEENFEICWQCNYSFIDNKVVEIKDAELLVDTIDEEKQCLRCNAAMKYIGQITTKVGPMEATIQVPDGMLFYNGYFDLYNCPDCGKVEFFLPRNIDE